MTPDDYMVDATLTGRNLEAQITKDYHRVEKGLALPSPKRPFGADVAARLNLLVPLLDTEAPYSTYANQARDALAAWNTDAAFPEEISPVRDASRRGITDPHAFFGSRHSVRNYSAVPVPADLLDEAVALAVQTPSVCNRQAWQVRFFSGADASAVLRFQNGNGGFRDNVPTVALITVDARMFAGASERNQPWIEGGLFSMSLAYAFHSLGLDTCMLNMSVLNRDAAALRSELALGESELIIMMVAVGYGAEGHRRARSPRRAVSDVLLPTGSHGRSN